MFVNKYRNGIGCFYRIRSEVVDFPEGFIGEPSAGLLLDRSVLARAVPGMALALSSNLVATAFPDRRIRLYSQRRWWEVRDALEKLPDKGRQVRKLKRITLGFQVTLNPSWPLIIPVSLQYFARLTGDDILLVLDNEYMEIWSGNAFDNAQSEGSR